MESAKTKKKDKSVKKAKKQQQAEKIEDVQAGVPDQVKIEEEKVEGKKQDTIFYFYLVFIQND